MKKISSHLFTKNNREIAVFYANLKDLKKRKIHKHDAIALQLDAQKGEDNTHTIFMRPDEALIIAKLLIDGVHKATKAFELGLKR